MKQFFPLLILIFSTHAGFTQNIYLRGDTINVQKDFKAAELRVKNSTKDSLGVATNVGGGLIRFKRPRLVDDSLFIGNDTILLNIGTAGWSLTGNAGLSASTNFLGTTDGVPLLFRVNNTRAGRIDLYNNAFFGTNAGPGTVPEEVFDNTAVGNGALTSITEGGDNTAVGSAALPSLTSGENNVAIGKLTLVNLTTGNYNTVFGSQSGAGITTGSSNTILGGNITGLPSNLSSNIIIGTGAGVIRQRFDASGNLNIALQGSVSDTTTYKPFVQDASGNIKRFSYWPGGGVAGWGLTGNTGTVDGTNFIGTTDDVPLTFRANNVQAGRVENADRNTALGYEAGLPASNEGQENTAVGFQALNATAEASSNTAVGAFALTDLEYGEGNIGIGRGALFTLTSGEYNMAFGNFAGHGITTGSRNTILGRAIGLPSSLSDNVIIATGGAEIRQQFDASGNLNFTLQSSITDTSTYKPLVQDASGNVKRATYWYGSSGTALTTVAFGTTPNANGGVISGNTLTLQPADATHPGGLSTLSQSVAGPKTWLGNATFSGTGTAITATSGSLGAILTGSSTGAVLTGGSFGVEAKSETVPLLASNTTTVGGVAIAGMFQRNGSYTASNNDGLELRFASRNSAGSSKDFALLHAVITNVTASSETGAFQIRLMNAGAVAALSYEFTPSLLTLNTGQLNIATQFTPANSSDATFGNKTITIDDNFIYYRTSSGTWKKIALSTF